MKHHAFAAAMGLLTAAVLVPGGQAQASAADPTGYWVKPDSERNAKIQITRCGKGKAQLCSNIVWLEDPNDSRGRPLQDIRNENPSMRGRTIQGLPLFTGLTRTGPATWTGKIYNPEDGNTYAATLTMVSKSQINLKGCKAWLLCGERVWKRTSPPPQVPKPEEQLIEAKAEPQAEPQDEPKAASSAQATAAAMPSAAKPAASPQSAPAPDDVMEAAAEPRTEMDAPQVAAAPAIELVTPAAPPAEHGTQPGYGFLNVSRSEANTAEFSGENVPSMFVMTAPLETEAVTPPSTAASQPAAPARTAAPLPKPKPPAKREATPQATAAATPKPQPPAQPAPQTDTMSVDADQQTAQVLDPESAETAIEAAPPLTRRQKRMLRRQQQQGLLPWLR